MPIVVGTTWCPILFRDPVFQERESWLPDEDSVHFRDLDTVQTTKVVLRPLKDAVPSTVVLH